MSSDHREDTSDTVGIELQQLKRQTRESQSSESDEVFEESDNVFGENLAEQEKLPCNFKDKGCHYEDYRMNHSKHREWTCEHSTFPCHICGKTFNGISQMQHCLSDHLSFPRQQDLLNLYNCKYGKSYQAVVTVYGVNFYCTWSTYKKNCFDASVICDTPKHQLRRYKFEVQLFFDKISPVMTGHMNVLKNSFFDWNFTGYAESHIYTYRMRLCVLRVKDSEAF